LVRSGARVALAVGMTNSHRVGLRILRASILLALGCAPVAGCQGYIVIDCSDAQPGADGLVDCGGLVKARPNPTLCEMPGPGNPVSCNDWDACHADTDCTDFANGRCNNDPSAGGCGCSYGCATDADCGDAMVCLCGEGGGTCVTAHCKTTADCPEGQSCVLYEEPQYCSGSSLPAFACTTDHDECLSDSQCGSNDVCAFQGDHFACVYPGCQEGRPFYVGGEMRTAPIVASGDWGSRLTPQVGLCTAEEREALSARWARIGQLEHASVASFARFAMQLLSLGAPPQLIEQTTQAMADETIHAKLAFGLASAYAGSAMGPGKLAVGDALSDGDLGAIVRTLVHEGCVGETVAAALAREERARTMDPAVSAVLDRITEDEERHSVLAWRALAWIMEQGEFHDEAVEVLADEVRSLRRELGGGVARADSVDSPKDGTLSEREMGILRSAVLEEVVLPTARALLGRGMEGTNKRERVSTLDVVC